MELICPICGEILYKKERQFVCDKGHCFDIARQGYVNLLPVQNKRSLNPGDTREQVLARRRFLEGGFYAPISRALNELAQGCQGPILDAGCGEGYYSTRLAEARGAELLGLDISKEAVRCAAASYKNALWVCGSAARLPVKDGSVGLITSLFAMTDATEFRRALKPGGYFIRVLAAPDHLPELKKVIYDQVFHKEKEGMTPLEGFSLVKTMPVTFEFSLEGQQVQDLLYMTPHVYRISKAGADRLRQTQTLTDRASCILGLYKAE